jgi:prepilin-type N-terminal cleavage/methylation domain-containing protein
MWNRLCRTAGSISTNNQRTATGFSLVEVLIALALGTWLVSSVGLTAQRLWLVAHLSGDEVELAERADFALWHLSQALLNAMPITNASVDLSPCGVFQPERYSADKAKTGVGIRVVRQGQFPCLPSKNLLENLPFLIIEQGRLGLETRCGESASSSGWLKASARDSALAFGEASGTPSAIEIVTEDCSAVIPAKSSGSRSLYYLRDFTWDEGDGFGALMMKVWRPEHRDFGRAEMLVPGVTKWMIEPVRLSVESLRGENRQLVSGVNLSLTLRGVRSGFGGSTAPQLGYRAFSEGSRQSMTVAALVLSRHLRAPSSYEQIP